MKTLALCLALLTITAIHAHAQAQADPELLAAIRQIKAIDHHAHPLKFVAAGEQPDTEFDALPLDARYMRELGRTDDGVDIETPPDGALVYSMTPGVVSAVAIDPGGFGHTDRRGAQRSVER